MKSALLVHQTDDVAVVTEAVLKGGDVTYLSEGKTMTIKAADDVPVWHKIAVKRVPRGGSVMKYGEMIGYATVDINIGDHVHTHNLSDLFLKAGDGI